MQFGFSSGAAENVGFATEPSTERFVFEETGRLGPIPVTADLTTPVVRYDDLQIEEAIDSDAGGEIGFQNFLSIPQVEVSRWTVASVAQWTLTEVWRDRPDLLGYMGDFDIASNLDEQAVERVRDAERVNWFGEREVYLADTVGRGFEFEGQETLNVNGTEITPEDVQFAFMPVTVDSDLRAHVAIGVKTVDEATGDAIFSVYVGGRTVLTDFVSDEFGPRTSGFALVAEEHIPDPLPSRDRFSFGIFSREQIDTFIGRFVDAVTASHAGLSS